MLYKTNGLSQDQLLADLLAIKQLLGEHWAKGVFHTHGNYCLVAAATKITEAQPSFGFIKLTKGTENQKLRRFGRAIATIYKVLRPNDSDNLTLYHAQHTIARFNDGPATHAAVMLLLDKAIEAALTPAVVEV